MIDRTALLSDLQGLLKRLEEDLLQRSESDEVPQVGQRLREEYERAKKAERTAQNYEDWRGDEITQAAAAWVLSCVFVRFLEDNRLISPPKIAGPGKELQRARDEHEIFFRAHPKLTDRDYLVSVFDELAALPGTKDVFGEHNPIRELPGWLSGDAAGELLRFFQRIDANTGLLVHDFTDDQWDTRFLGDLYQDLSEAARKKYALLQTPEFVEEFILDRTLEPALDEFFVLCSSFLAESPVANRQEQTTKNQEQFRMIDPACGSGHFLLGAFPRILRRWQKQEPGTNIRELVQRTLDSIHGVDVNPYAVAIARFRLLLMAMRAEGIRRLAEAPAYRFHLACGDSLLHGRPGGDQLSLGQWRDVDHVYAAEDPAELQRLLTPGSYHAVVANPPYITPKDRALNEAYRERYSACHRQYSLAVPFMQRLFDLALRSQEPTTKNQQLVSGYIGQITANSFMKREFGKKLIEQFLPTVDLTHVIDTSGAYIPGHGTPTVILFGRNRKPVGGTVRAVMGIRGEPSTPEDPSRGLVWSAILAQVDQPGSQSEFVSVSDTPRDGFHKHPWSIGGGGAAELKEQLDEQASQTLNGFVDLIGFVCMTRADDVYFAAKSDLLRHRVPHENTVLNVEGDRVRDWTITDPSATLFPYARDLRPIVEDSGSAVIRFLWPHRTHLWLRREPNGDHRTLGLTWYEWSRFQRERYRHPLSVAYAEVATHNHFVLDRGGKVFNRTAPVIKLPAGTSEDDHLALLGLLNSSTACFWLKQVCFPKGGDHVGQEGARVRRTVWDERYAFNATNVAQFPLPEDRPNDLTRQLDALAQRLQSLSPAASLAGDIKSSVSLRSVLEAAREQWERMRQEMIALQEELDWECYRLYGLIEEDLTQSRQCAKKDEPSRRTKNQEPTTNNLGALAPLREPPPLSLGQRAFEIVMARRMAAGEFQTTWFERHGSTPITELPADWPDDYKRLVERRIELIETDRNIGLIEQPEYKRRWNTEPWESQLERALRSWLTDRLETYFDFDGRMAEDLTPRREGAKKDEVPHPTNDQEPRANNLGAFAPLREISLYSVARLADAARQDPDFMQVAEVYRDDPAFDVERLVAELVEAESVPLLPVLRYKPSGLRKRAEWEKTWELQREEDLGLRSSDLENKDLRPKTEDPIPVPPKYTSADFLRGDYWRLRGKLDVPKERWVSFPHCEGPDGTLVIAWAGYDHLQLARSVSAYYVEIQERLGGRDDPRLVPLLACLVELLPWLKQWHNDPDPAFDGLRMGDYFEGFIAEEARQLGKTVPEIKAWEPVKTRKARGKAQR